MAIILLSVNPIQTLTYFLDIFFGIVRVWRRCSINIFNSYLAVFFQLII